MTAPIRFYDNVLWIGCANSMKPIPDQFFAAYKASDCILATILCGIGLKAFKPASDGLKQGFVMSTVPFRCAYSRQLLVCAFSPHTPLAQLERIGAKACANRALRIGANRRRISANWRRI